MAQTKNLVVTSLQTNGDKVFIRVGDSSPQSTSTNSSAIQFLQDSEKTFQTSGTQSAFRIRHNSQDSQLVFQVSNRDGDTYSALTINDLGGINVNSVLTFEDSQFIQLSAEDITAKHIVMNNTTQITGAFCLFLKYKPPQMVQQDWDGIIQFIEENTSGDEWKQATQARTKDTPVILCQSEDDLGIEDAFYGIIQYMDIFDGYEDAIMWGDTTDLIKQIPSTISKSINNESQFIITADQITGSFSGDGSQLTGISAGGWKTFKKIDSPILGSAEYTIYTTSVNQVVDNYNYLTVFLNDTLLTQSSSINPNWDYKSNGTDSTSIIFNYNIPVIPGSDFYLTYQYSGGK